jgi:hypothetical protein
MFYIATGDTVFQVRDRVHSVCTYTMASREPKGSANPRHNSTPCVTRSAEHESRVSGEKVANWMRQKAQTEETKVRTLID